MQTVRTTCTVDVSVSLIRKSHFYATYSLENSIFYDTCDAFISWLFDELDQVEYRIEYECNRISVCFKYGGIQHTINFTFHECSGHRDVNDNWLLQDDEFLLAGLEVEDGVDFDTFQELLAYIVSELRGDDLEYAIDLFEQKYR